MGRAHRVQPIGIALHITTRGIRDAPIFLDDSDRRLFMGLLAQTVHRCRWTCLAYCLMTNHFHVLATLSGANLSNGMHRLNGTYARRFNERYGHTGHLFEARFSSTVIESNEHLLESVRYIVNNPVRAGVCFDPGDWPWSSFRATAGFERCPPFLAAGRVRRLFGRGSRGAELYAEFVRERAGIVLAR
ncbi:MAG: transposase [Actinobacteria bacterium]|nr:transposase [Actinomycetota bacterium]